MRLLSRHTWCLGVLALFLCGSVRAQSGLFRPLPASAWGDVVRAKGIQVGGQPNGQSNIQIIFDANCPYCAKLYKAIRQNYPNVTVRWVPVAYISSDSAALAAAILDSSDPAASLDANFREYDFNVQHGGYPLPKSHDLSLITSIQRFTREWKIWGALTPMMIVRNREGRVLRIAGYISDPEALKRIMTGAAPALPATPKLRNYRELHSGQIRGD